jgi:hypothetical protein
VRPSKPSALTLMLQEARDNTPLTSRCTFCGWTHHGTAIEGRAAALEHRRAEHPEAAARPRRPRARRSWPKTSLRTSSDEAQIRVDAAEANRVRAEREDGERLEKVLRALARDAA